MRSDEGQFEEIQKAVCKQFSAEYVPTRRDQKLGFANSTAGQVPINGLRHSPTIETSGWYIWCGEFFSEAPDFFEARHAFHFYDERHDIARLLGLAPGWRFLLAGDYIDVWFDSTLLTA